MANTLITNRLATAAAVRIAQSLPYLTVGSKAYFKNQLADKEGNGQSYTFYIRDCAKAYNRLDHQAGDKTEMTQRAITLSLDPWHVLIQMNAIEQVTDVKDWEDDIAKGNIAELLTEVSTKIIDSDLGKIGTGFIGSGFLPLSLASAHVGSIADGDLYGFCDPNVEAVLTSNGQQFQPVDAPDMYKKGLLGTFHDAEYRKQRYFPKVVVSTALANAVASAKVTGATDNGDGTWTMVASGFTAGINIPKGYPLFIDGVKATDLIGHSTETDQCWVVLEAVQTTGATVGLKVRAKAIVDNGTREICAEDGTSFATPANVTGNTYGPEAGRYFMGIVRADGAMEFECLPKLIASGAEYQKSPTVEGVIVHQNRLVDLKAMTDDIRWDIVTLAGVVESRAVVAFYVK